MDVGKDSQNDGKLGNPGEMGGFGKTTK
jgi:hypothetical protein